MATSSDAPPGAPILILDIAGIQRPRGRRLAARPSRRGNTRSAVARNCSRRPPASTPGRLPPAPPVLPTLASRAVRTDNDSPQLTIRGAAETIGRNRGGGEAGSAAGGAPDELDDGSYRSRNR